MYNKIANFIGFTGAFLVLIGVFCPVVDIPFEGSVSYINRWVGSGILVIVLSFITGILSFFGKSRYLWLPAIIIGVIILYHLYDLNQKLDQYSFGNSFFKANFKSLFSLQWGWILLVGSVVLLLISSILSHRQVKP